MAEDIVPELYEQIHADFEQKVNHSKIVRTFRSRLEKKTADAKGVLVYARELGRCATGALTGNLTEENLPDGKLYWNILERTVDPLLREIWKMVTDAAKTQQEAEDKKTGINLKPIEPEYQELRVRDFMDKLMEYAEDE